MYTRVPCGEHLQTSLTLTRALRDEVVDPGTSRRHAPSYVRTHPTTLFPSDAAHTAALGTRDDCQTEYAACTRARIFGVSSRACSAPGQSYVRPPPSLRHPQACAAFCFSPASASRSEVPPMSSRARREWSFATADTLGCLSMGCVVRPQLSISNVHLLEGSLVIMGDLQDVKMRARRGQSCLRCERELRLQKTSSTLGILD